jgi:chromate transporter
VWIALPLVFVLPGTHTNIGIFIGAMVDGFRGALLALISLNLPCFLSIFGLLPEWKNYRDREGIRRLCEGLTCATTGLTLGMVRHCIYR